MDDTDKNRKTEKKDKKREQSNGIKQENEGALTGKCWKGDNLDAFYSLLLYQKQTPR